MVLVVSLVGGYARGAAQGAVEAAHAQQRTGVSDDQWWAARAGLRDVLRRHPLPHRGQRGAGGWLRPPEGGLDYNLQHAVDSFEFGLQRVLDGIDAFVRQRSTQPDQDSPPPR
jgi:hypothetical protein